MKNNSVQTTVVLGFSAQLLSDFYHMEFFDKNGVRTGGALVCGAMQPKRGRSLKLRPLLRI